MPHHAITFDLLPQDWWQAVRAGRNVPGRAVTNPCPGRSTDQGRAVTPARPREGRAPAHKAGASIVSKGQKTHRFGYKRQKYAKTIPRNKKNEESGKD